MRQKIVRQEPMDLSIYLVTDTVMCGQPGVAATVSAAVGAGVTAVQLRDVDATDDELVDLGREILAVLEGTDVPLIVNDRVHLVDAMGAQGAHVGQSDLGIDRARALLGPTAYLGLSVQTVEHLAAAREQVDGELDYLGVGPVWGTATKLDAAAPGGLERLHRITSLSPWPCVAIGGITLENLPQVRRAGAAGVAVVSAICGQPDVATATRALRAAWDGGSG
ncbi:MAG TPA: thiamine phosphate synthase [Dermatophilaceae bacterium]|jgi:thiamine-phosphate pyrophosphorylase